MPGVTTQVATFQIINGLGLYNTKAAPILLFMGTDIIAIYIFIQFMQSIPVSLDEAAMIDGANRWTIYWRIILPLLKPAIATVVIIKGIAVYNEFYIPFLYLPSRGPDLDVAVPVQGTVRRAVGGHRRRHHPRHHPDPRRLPAAAALHLQRPHLRSRQVTDSTSTIAQTALARRELHAGWQLRPRSGPAPARSPPRRCRRRCRAACTPTCSPPASSPIRTSTTTSRALAWIGLVDWTYARRFDWTRRRQRPHDLVFEGLDTVAASASTASAIGATRNQHRTYRFDVRDALVEGENELVVRVRARRQVRRTRRASRSGRGSARIPCPYNAIRKLACSFGWDWGIATSTCGIWQPVRLESLVARPASRSARAPAGR